MKQKLRFPGELCTLASYFWKEHKYLLVIFLIAITMILYSVLTYAQEIKTGQAVPATVIKNVVNYKSPELRLTDFNNKLLIIDFWATYCTPCRKLLPGYDSLQREFGDKIQFLLVTTEPKTKAEKFIRDSHYTLPSVTADNLLVKLFPHNSVPHEVWVRNGKVIATTFGAEVNRAQLLRVLSGQAADMEQKDDNLSFDENKPLLINGNATGRVLYQSLITPYLPGLNSAAGIRQTENGPLVMALNGSVLSLYRLAFSKIDPLFELSNRFILDVPDSLKDKLDIETGEYHAWIKKYGFSYSLALPANFKGDISRFMLDDFNRFFSSYMGISAHLEKRTVDCMVLSRIPGGPSLASQRGAFQYIHDVKHFRLRNLPIQKLVWALAFSYRKQQAPLIDETGYLGPVDLDLTGDLGDPAQLREQLQKNGLQLTFQTRSIDLAVIQYHHL